VRVDEVLEVRKLADPEILDVYPPNIRVSIPPVAVSITTSKTLLRSLIQCGMSLNESRISNEE
jgi:hypothetical protein